jgi:hypothetical protein
MWGWIVFAAVGALVAAAGFVASRRWGRGAYEGSFEDPVNEVQDTTPRKLWP